MNQLDEHKNHFQEANLIKLTLKKQFVINVLIAEDGRTRQSDIADGSLLVWDMMWFKN